MNIEQYITIYYRQNKGQRSGIKKVIPALTLAINKDVLQHMKNIT
jgi:hypothetical protein